MARSPRTSVLKTPLPGQIQRHVFMFATVHATDAYVTFYDGPGMHTVKQQSRFITARGLPC